MNTALVLIPPDEVAATLGTTKDQLAHERCAGKGLPWVRVRGRIFYLAHIASGRRQPEQQFGV